MSAPAHLFLAPARSFAAALLVLLATAAGLHAQEKAAPASGEKIRIACIGDSITAGSGYPAALQKKLGDAYEVKNFGVSGSTLLANGNHPYIKTPKWKAALEFRPHIATIKLGTNDTKLANYSKIDQAPHDLNAMIDELQKLDPPAKVFLCKPVPVFGEGNFGIDQARLVEGIIPAVQKVAADRRLPVIDLHTPLTGRADLFGDRVHPKGAQDIMADAILEVLKRELPAELRKGSLAQ